VENVIEIDKPVKLILVTSFITFNAQAQGRLFWNDNTKLSWSDFTGAVPRERRWGGGIKQLAGLTQ
jgi:hypothetical protein